MADVTAAVQARLPSYNIVNAIEAPGGGIWAVGADGGVFALDGAPFLGAYTTDAMAPHRNDPSRRFVAIQADPETGGYRLISNKPHEPGYTFSDPNRAVAPGGPGSTPGGEAPPATATPPGVDANETVIRSLLDTMGLGSIMDKAWTFWKSMGMTATSEAVNVWIRTQNEFKTRFPAMGDLEAKGEYWTPARYLQYEQEVKSAMRSAGIPGGFWDEPEDISKLIRNDWSKDEVVDAIRQAEQAVLTMPPDVKAQMQAYGMTNGDLTAFWLNPDKGQTLMERKFAQEVAGVGAAGTRAGFGLSKDESTLLTQQVGGEAAGRGLAAYGAQAALLAETADEDEDLGQSTVLGAVGGNVKEASKIERRRANRQARFEGGGGAAGFGQGTSGLGGT